MNTDFHMHWVPGQSKISIGIWVKPDCSFWRTSGKTGMKVACCGGRTLEAKLLEIVSSIPFSGGDHLGKIWTDLSALKSPRPNNPGGFQPHASVNSLPKDLLGTQLPLITSRDKAPPTRGTSLSPTYQWASTSPSYQEAWNKPLYHHHP